jgi:hypothetical protein
LYASPRASGERRQNTIARKLGAARGASAGEAPDFEAGVKSTAALLRFRFEELSGMTRLTSPICCGTPSSKRWQPT